MQQDNRDTPYKTIKAKKVIHTPSSEDDTLNRSKIQYI